MINTLRIYEELREVMDPKPAQKLASVLGLIYEDLQDTVKRSDLEALQRVVSELAVSQKELAEAQKQTETRLRELTEAQQHTEARVGELVEARKRTEARLGELAEAQKRTEARVEALTRSQQELAEAQKRTETRLQELAQAQKRTETALAKLAERLDDTTKQLGGLAITIGYTLDRFIRSRVEPLKPVCGRIFPILVAHMVSSRDVPEYARQRGVALYLSYQFGNQ